jgi:hypothetical protein
LLSLIPKRISAKISSVFSSSPSFNSVICHQSIKCWILLWSSGRVAGFVEIVRNAEFIFDCFDFYGTNQVVHFLLCCCYDIQFRRYSPITNVNTDPCNGQCIFLFRRLASVMYNCSSNFHWKYLVQYSTWKLVNKLNLLCFGQFFHLLK